VIHSVTATVVKRKATLLLQSYRYYTFDRRAHIKALRKARY